MGQPIRGFESLSIRFKAPAGRGASLAGRLKRTLVGGFQMSSELNFHQQLVLAAVSGLTASGKSDVADKSIEIADAIIEQYPETKRKQVDGQMWSGS